MDGSKELTKRWGTWLGTRESSKRVGPVICQSQVERMDAEGGADDKTRPLGPVASGDNRTCIEWRKVVGGGRAAE